MPLLAVLEWEQHKEEGYSPPRRVKMAKTQRGGAYPSPPRRENKKHTIGHDSPSLPSSSSSPSRVFRRVIVWWHAGVEGGGGEGGEGDGGGGGWRRWWV